MQADAEEVLVMYSCLGAFKSRSWKYCIKELLSTIIICGPHENQSKENLSQKRLSNDTKVDFGTTKDIGLQKALIQKK